MLFIVIMTCSASAESPDAMQAGDILWFGEWDGKSVSWLILDNRVQNTGEPGMFLFSEYVVSNGGVKYSDAVAAWENSSAQAWCESFWNNAFTSAESGAVPAAFKTTEGRSELFGLYWKPADLKGEHVFFISAEELSQYVGADDGAEGLSGFSQDGQCVYYWLRSPHGFHGDYSGLVLQNDQVHDYLVYGYWGGRPAMNLDPAQLLYVSSVGEKQWKAGVIDSSILFDISGFTTDGDRIELKYSSSESGANAELIMLIYDRAGSLSEIRSLGSAQSSGTIVFDSAADIPEASAAAFAVRIAGDDRHSDAVSPVADIKAEVSFDPGRGSGEMAPMGVIPGTPITALECTFTAPEGKCFDHWELNGEELTQDYRVENDICLTAVYDDIKISGIELGGSKLSAALGESIKLNALTSPDDAVNKALGWKSSNPLIVSVKADGNNTGIISPRRPGTAVITCASLDGGSTAEITVTVTGSVITAFFSNPESLVLAALLAVIILVLLKKKLMSKAAAILFILPLALLAMFVINSVGEKETIETTPPTPEPTEIPFVEPVLEKGGTIYFNGEEPAHGTFIVDGISYIKLSDAAQLLESELTANDDGSLSFSWRKGTAVLRAEDCDMDYLDKSHTLDAPPILSERGADMYVPVVSFCDAIEVGTLYDEEFDTLYCTPGRGGWELPQGYNVPVFMYHGTGHASPDANLIVDPSSLREQFQYLNDNGYTTLFFDELWHVEDFEKPVILTFDDGWENNYTDLFPLLQEYNIKATISVVPNLMYGNGIHMTTEQASEMSKSPLVSIQSHTMTHEFLNGFNEEHQRYELSQSQLLITRMTKQIPYLLAYPTGACDQLTLDILPDYYRFGMRMYNGFCYNTADEPGLIYRFYVGRETPIGEFRDILERVEYGYHGD